MDASAPALRLTPGVIGEFGDRVMCGVELVTKIVAGSISHIFAGSPILKIDRLGCKQICQTANLSDDY